MRTAWLLLSTLAALTAAAQELPPIDQPIEESPEQVLVVGEQPGPRLWKVTGHDHVLWLMGAIGTLPKNMTWHSREVERVIGESQQILTGVEVHTDVGFFTKMTLLPSLISVRKNPEKQKLAEVLPIDLYERWSRLKQQYLGKENDVESWRPIFAAQKLYAAAIDKAGLTGRAAWWEDIQKMAKARKVPSTRPRLEVDIEKPRAALKEFKKAPLDDVECFRRTLDRIENDMATMRLRANAWAVGDIEALQRLPYVDVLSACANAVLSSSSAQQQGLVDVPQRIAQTWIDAADAALRTNASTLAIVPLEEILKPDGWVAALVARGYVLESPEAE
ncbi:MAG TPA: TraB/GumN family protein [Povalibacter sp.]